VLSDENLNRVDFHWSDEKSIFKYVGNELFLIIGDSE
jgi:hypothetical protein